MIDLKTRNCKYKDFGVEEIEDQDLKDNLRKFFDPMP
jgi:hypothetical protein